MPGRTPYLAVDAFLDPLRSALACVAQTKIIVTSSGRREVDQEHWWALPGDDGYIRLGGPGRLQMFARMRYKIITDKRKDYGPYRVTTRGYMYGLRSPDNREVLQYHWHPSGQSHEQMPHLHIGSAQIADDAVISESHHLPTGRITFESVIRMAIKEFRVEPLHEDWEDRLMAAETPHILYRSWPSATVTAPPAVK